MSTRPNYRKGKVQDLAYGAANFISELVAESRDALPTCLNCAYHEIHNDACGERVYCHGYKAYPPPRIVVAACPGWADVEQIPF